MVRERSRELRSMYVRTLKHLSIVAVPLIGIPALCAPFIVPFIFGEAWVEAGWYCWPLAVMVIANFVISPTSHLQLYGYNRWALVWDITRFCGVVSGFYVSQLLGATVIFTIAIYAIIMVALYLVLVFLNLEAISRFTSKITG